MLLQAAGQRAASARCPLKKKYQRLIGRVCCARSKLPPPERMIASTSQLGPWQKLSRAMHPFGRASRDVSSIVVPVISFSLIIIIHQCRKLRFLICSQQVIRLPVLLDPHPSYGCILLFLNKSV